MTYFYVYYILCKVVRLYKRTQAGALKDLHIAILGDIYGNLLTDRQKDIVRDYFDCDLSLSEIAQQYGITRQAVADTIKTSERMLCKYENELGFGAKLTDIKARIRNISDLIGNGNCEEAKAEADKLFNELW